MRITQYKALAFSCYGTLFDREGGILEALRPLSAHTQPRWLLAAYRRLLATLREEMPGAEQAALHLQVYLRLAQELHQSADWDAGIAFGNKAGQWSIFEDVPGALMYLGKFYRLLLISPADTGHAAALAGRLPVTFDAIVENRGGDWRAGLQASLAALGLARRELLPVRSPAKDDPWDGIVDFPVCTLRRDHASPWQGGAQAVDVKRCEYSSLAELVHAHQVALRA